MDDRLHQQNVIEFAPGMRVVIRDEEWMIKKVENNSFGKKTLYCIGISPLVKDHEAVFLTDLEHIEKIDPTKIKLVPDDSPFFAVLDFSSRVSGDRRFPQI